MITEIDNGVGGTLLSPDMAVAVRRMFMQSFADIFYAYPRLTPNEKSLLTEAQFSALCAWLRAGLMTDAELVTLYERHCECRPTDTARTSHSHDCECELLEDIALALHGPPDTAIRARTYVTLHMTKEEK